MRYTLSFLLWILPPLLISPLLWASQTKEVTFSADQTEVFIQNGTLVEKYTGNVTATREDMHLSADTVIYYEAQSRVELAGNVCVKDTSTSIRADSVVYWIDTGKVTAQGAVRAQTKDRTLSCDRATYLKEEKRIIASGKVRLVDPSQQTTVTGGQAEYNLTTEAAVITRHPEFLKIGREGEEPLIITARKLELQSKARKMVAFQDVHLHKSQTDAFCGQLTYLQSEGKLSLHHNPRVVQVQPAGSEQTLKGNIIEITLNGEAIKKVTVRGKASGKTVEKNGQELSQIAGRKISLKFESGNLQQIVVEGNATSSYYLFSAKDSHQETNNVSGDKICFFFREGKIYRVSVSGGAIGTYTSSSKF